MKQVVLEDAPPPHQAVHVIISPKTDNQVVDLPHPQYDPWNCYVSGRRQPSLLAHSNINPLDGSSEDWVCWLMAFNRRC